MLLGIVMGRQRKRRTFTSLLLETRELDRTTREGHDGKLPAGLDYAHFFSFFYNELEADTDFSCE